MFVILKPLLKYVFVCLLYASIGSVINFTFNTHSVAAGECGVHTGNVHSYAGLIVEMKWRRSSDGREFDANNTQVYISTDQPTRTPAGNIIRFPDGYPGIGEREDRRVMSGTLDQIDTPDCGDRRNVVLGYGVTSPLDGVPGAWMLDCDATLRGGDYQRFTIEGRGVPNGAIPGGEWSSVRNMPMPNGYTSYVTLVYTEPGFGQGGHSTVYVERQDGSLRDTVTTGRINGNQNEKVITAYVGDHAWWSHVLNVPRGADYGQHREGNGEFEEGVAPGIGKRGHIGAPGGEEQQLFNRNYTFKPADVGRKFCAWTSWDMGSGGGWTGTDKACVIVMSVPDVYPVMAGSGTTETVNIGSSRPTRASAFNIGYVNSQNVPYSVREFVVPAGQTLPDFNSFFNQQSEWQGKNVYYREDDVTENECSWLKRQFGVIQCRDENTRTGARVFGSRETFNIDDLRINAMDYEVGQKVCRFISVRRFTDGVPDSRLRASRPFCVIVAKSPKVQVQGGDLVVGRNYSGNAVTSSRVRTTSMQTEFDGSQYSFGSWAEYGIIAPGAIESVSGAAYANHDVRRGTPRVDSLTFANTPNKGHYGNVGTIPDVVKQVEVLYPDASPLPNNPNLNALNGRYTASGDVTIKGGNNIGKNVIVRSTGKVTIEGNITYTASQIGSLSDLPQVIIIAKDIVINDSVEQIDAWLIAYNSVLDTNNPATISTCGAAISDSGPGQYASGLRAGVCGQKLIINGPVISQQLQLRRTYGSAGHGATAEERSNNINEPAEVINLRPDTYLWTANQAKSRSMIHTTYTRELPPRF